ncbi:MAG: YfiR family protein [Burkholderiaceae bacterium]
MRALLRRRPDAAATPSCARRLRRLLQALALLSTGLAVQAQELPEYRLKAAFLYNFALLTEWPATAGTVLNLCVHGRDPFGAEVDALQGKMVGSRSIAVLRVTGRDNLQKCQILFIAAPSIEALPKLLESLHDSPVLTVADSADAARRGVAINMAVGQSRISFEVNLKVARDARLVLSSKLLRLATEVYP